MWVHNQRFPHQTSGVTRSHTYGCGISLCASKWEMVKMSWCGQKRKRKEKNNARTMYRHECEPVNPILIMLLMGCYASLCWCGHKSGLHLMLLFNGSTFHVMDYSSFSCLSMWQMIWTTTFQMTSRENLKFSHKIEDQIIFF